MGHDQQQGNRTSFLTADVVFGISLVLGLVLHYFMPLSFGVLGVSVAHHLIGASMLLFGGFVIVMSKRELASMGESSEPRSPTLRIIKSGPYRYSRNPLYVGLTVCYAGLAFAINRPWFLILLIPTLLATQLLLIGPEEKYLEAAFGKEYLEYKKSVRRWF